MCVGNENGDLRREVLNGFKIWFWFGCWFGVGVGLVVGWVWLLVWFGFSGFGIGGWFRWFGLGLMVCGLVVWFLIVRRDLVWLGWFGLFGLVFARTTYGFLA